MKATFKINKLGAQERSKNYDKILTSEILNDIALRLINTTDYDVIWVNEKNVGRLITLETDTAIHYINMSQYGPIQSRNNYFQSVPTALSQYINTRTKSKKEKQFHFYFLPFTGNNKTDYMLFQYRILKTIGINILNADYGLNNLIIEPYTSAKTIIKDRNKLRSSNSANQSTFITDEHDCYHIYGKTFGANQKETTLLCFAIATVSEKPIKLFQILDNGSTELSSNDCTAILNFCKQQKLHDFKILEDSYTFEGKQDSEFTEKEDLRSPTFIYNLLSKFNGEKKCALCGCKIECIVQGAHIYPVSAIRKRDDLSLETKLAFATDKDNGIWLCENHHKLFDRNLISFRDGELLISNDLSSNDNAFIEKITTQKSIETQFINERMLAFFDLRYSMSPRINLV